MATLTENVQKVVDATAALKTSIAAKGVTVPVGSKLSALPALVDKIKHEEVTNRASTIIVMTLRQDGTIENAYAEGGNTSNPGDFFQVSIPRGETVTLPTSQLEYSMGAHLILTGLQGKIIISNAQFLSTPFAKIRHFEFRASEAQRSIEFSADAFSQIRAERCVFQFIPKASLMAMKNYPWGAPKGTVFECQGGEIITI